MTLSPTQSRQLTTLFLLRDEAGTDYIDLKFVSFWERLREEYGLVGLLTMIEAHVVKLPRTDNAKKI